jgi:hypothetical protein
MRGRMLQARPREGAEDGADSVARDQPMTDCDFNLAAFGVSMETMMKMQNSYDIARARERVGQIAVERYRAA